MPVLYNKRVQKSLNHRFLPKQNHTQLPIISKWLHWTKLWRKILCWNGKYAIPPEWRECVEISLAISMDDSQWTKNNEQFRALMKNGSCLMYVELHGNVNVTSWRMGGKGGRATDEHKWKVYLNLFKIKTVWSNFRPMAELYCTSCTPFTSFLFMQCKQIRKLFQIMMNHRLGRGFFVENALVALRSGVFVCLT